VNVIEEGDGRKAALKGADALKPVVGSLDFWRQFPGSMCQGVLNP
jgi:hypothetical protein